MRMRICRAVEAHMAALDMHNTPSPWELVMDARVEHNKGLGEHHAATAEYEKTSR